MSMLNTGAVILALLGSAVIAGVFFAFSSFIMRALGKLPSPDGIAAMQSINVVVINPAFLGTFMGTAVLSLLVAALAIKGWGTPSAPFFLVGALLYLVGTFLVTGLGNVPLNERLAAVSAADSEAVAVWVLYLDRWTSLNTIRTVAATAAALLFTVGLMQGAGG
jgi:uncharacterized membrane protein